MTAESLSTRDWSWEHTTEETFASNSEMPVTEMAEKSHHSDMTDSQHYVVGCLYLLAGK